MHARSYFRTRSCIRIAYKLLHDATTSARNTGATDCRRITNFSQQQEYNFCTRLHNFDRKNKHAVICRGFSTSLKNLKLDGTPPVASHADGTSKLNSDVQSDAAADMKVADIGDASETLNSSPDNLRDDETPSSGKFLLSFKCKPCDHRMMRFISKQAYRKGLVIVKCESCSVLHLMADNLGWFKTTTGFSTVNVEQLLAEKGEKVRTTLAELDPDDVKILEDDMDSILDVPDSLRVQLGQLKLA